ncbi:MAG: hypothetical protein HN352_02270 [Bacteroidetes bacterium]|jgi:transmembrane sensor|nr:hypothetical protein [Bacteroidota bacterium]MBT3750734.1 hypothetical protein [Bacteroidota bacterium]MBT4412055.1 hypothetical protein [Bacteroidota bacterium]MBT5427787.1 hypothetical protein [Bacteroidota bacterium]MBT7091919.1 hypothetical protein [Bacteroidota bacterium]
MQNDPIHIDKRLLLLYLLDEISEKGRQEVEAWIRYSASNKQTFRELEQTWHETGQLEPQPVAVDVDKAWNRMEQLMLDDNEVQNDESLDSDIQFQDVLPPMTGRARTLYWSVAVAALAIISVLSVIYTDWFKNTTEIFPSLKIESFAEVVFDTLSDGSSIALNEQSVLSFPETFVENERSVELKGEAFFSVKADTAKPFVIKAGTGQVRVLGTEFNVKAYPNEDMEVVVESGLVELVLTDSLGAAVKTLLLEAGEKGVLSKANKELYRSSDLQPDELFWADRKLIFQETELADVFVILKKYYEFEILVSDKGILACLLSASFTGEKMDHIMAVIAASFELELITDGDQYKLTGVGCSRDE